MDKKTIEELMERARKRQFIREVEELEARINKINRGPLHKLITEYFLKALGIVLSIFILATLLGISP